MSKSAYDILEKSQMQPVWDQDAEDQFEFLRHQRQIDALKRKLAKKAQAVLKAKKKEDLLQEMADVDEVFSALRELLYFTEGDLKQASDNKRLQQPL